MESPREVDDTVPATLALALLTAVSAVSFGRLFNDGSFLGPVLLAAAGVHTVAWLCRRFSVNGPVAYLAGTATILLVIAWDVLPETTVYGIPWTGTVDTALDELSRAMSQFKTVVAPAPVSKGFIVATVLGTGVAAMLADWAAFRMRALFEAIIPSFTLFLFSAILGAPKYHGLSIAAYVAAIVIFVVIQHARLLGSTTSWFASQSRGGMAGLLQIGALLGLAAVVAAVALAPRLPWADDAAVIKWRNSERRGPGNRETISPLVDIRGRLVDRSNLEAFTVRSNARAYWRLTSLDTFNGDIWSSNTSYRSARGRLPRAVPSRVQAEVAAQEFRIGSLGSIWLPAAYEPSRVSGVDGASYNADSGSLISANPTSDGLEYRVESLIPRPDAPTLEGTGAVLSQDVRSQYLDLPAGLSGRIVALTRRVTGNARTPYAKALALQQFFRTNFTYDLSVPAGHSDSALDRFLFERRRGYCEQFAGAYGVMARLAGLPTRVAVGFTPGEVGADGVFHVRGLNAHSWPEVYFEGVGWVPFEPTPGRGVPGGEGYTGVREAQAVPENPTTASTAAPPTTAPPADDPQNRPSTTVPNQELTQTTPEEQDDSFWRPAWRKILAIAIVLGLLVWLVGVPVAKRIRRDIRRSSATAPDERVLVAWDEAAEALALVGARRRLAETLPEYASRAATVAALPDGQAQMLADLAVDASAASYSAGAMPPTVAERAMQAASAIESHLTERVGTARRIRWALDPRPLRPRHDARRSITAHQQDPVN